MRKLLLLLNITLCAISANAQWQFNGPHDPTTFLGGSSFFLTTANASGVYCTYYLMDPQWNFVEDSGLTTKNITSFVTVGPTNFVVGSDQGIFIASNPVTTWTAIDSGLTSKSITALATNGSNLFAGTLNNGVFFSADTGKLWVRVNNGLTDTAIISLAKGNADTVFAATGNGVFLSSNNGASWIAINKGLSDSSSITALDLSRGDTIFAATAGGVFLSTNSGVKWVAKNNGLTNTDITSIISDTYGGVAATIYLTTKGSGVFMSTDNGNNWSPLDSGLTDSNVVSVAIAGWYIYVATNNNGVMALNENTNEWGPFNNGFPGDSTTAMTFLGSSIYSASLNGIYVSNDNGATWTPSDNGLTTTDVISLATWQGNLFAGTNGGGIFVSTDQGNTWTAKNDSLKGYGSNIVVTTIVVSGSNVYAGTISGGVFVSTDTGNTWKNLGLVGAEINSISISDSIFLSAGLEGAVFLSTNYGSTWKSIGSSFYGSPLYTAINGTNLFVTVVDTVFASDNYGSSWKPVYSFGNWDYCPMLVIDSELFLSSPNYGIVRSANNGSSWTTDNAGLPFFDVTCLLVSGSTLFAATGGNGLWSQSLTQLINGSVWPGDANEDLTVNNYDLLPIGLYYGDTGTARDTTTIVWAPHVATDWDSLQANGANIKFVDCNGDGTINAEDTLAIVQNYGLTHPLDAPRGAIERTTGTVQLSIVADSSSYHAGSMVHASVMLGSSANPTTNIYGLAYDIAFDASNVEPGTLTFNYNNASFMGAKNTNALILTQLNNDVETVVTGIDHTDKTGYGKIGDLYFTLANSSAGQLELSISSYEAVDAKGNEIGLSPIGDTVTVTTGISQLLAIGDQLSVYPNPVSNTVFIKINSSISDLQDWIMQISDELGRVVYKANSLNHLNEVDMSKLPCSMYFISVISPTGSVAYPVIKQ